MVRKCGFFDCDNPAEKDNSCQSCEDRKEYNICSACRQTEPEQHEELNRRPSLFQLENTYKIVEKIRDKIPVQFRTELNLTLSQVKLSEAEVELIKKIKKIISDFLAEKGGKQDHINWFKFCSVCEPEFSRLTEEFSKQYPESKDLEKRIKSGQNEMEKIFEKVEKVSGEEELERIQKEVIEEVYNDIEKNNENPTGPNDRNNPNDRPNPNQNDAKIIQLQQEVNGLKQEINDLKNPRNPTPPSPNILQEKERKLAEKEAELKELAKNNRPLSNNQPDKNDNSKTALYIAFGVIGTAIILLFVLLISQKKKKKKNNLKIINLRNGMKL